jgi:endonuclease YncB( thermonuclease family)
MKPKLRRSIKNPPLSKNMWAKIVGGSILATGAFVLVVFGHGNPIPVPAYTVSRVIDGDTFVTKENIYVRVASIEAPPLDLCGGKEAKIALESYVLGKPVVMKILFRDPYNRQVSLVYTPSLYVNEALVKNGFAYYLPRTTAESVTELKKAGEYAREKKLGIFSETCTQTINKEQPACTIKGNTRNGNIYYLPACGVYPNTQVQLYLGDRWFCSEKDAISAGFRKPAQCK